MGEIELEVKRETEEKREKWKDIGGRGVGKKRVRRKER